MPLSLLFILRYRDDGVIFRTGWVTDGSGRKLMSADTFSTGPNFRLPVGHAATHKGSRPRVRLWTQESHFWVTRLLLRKEIAP